MTLDRIWFWMNHLNHSTKSEATQSKEINKENKNMELFTFPCNGNIRFQFFFQISKHFLHLIIYKPNKCPTISLIICCWILFRRFHNSYDVITNWDLTRLVWIILNARDELISDFSPLDFSEAREWAEYLQWMTRAKQITEKCHYNWIC